MTPSDINTDFSRWSIQQCRQFYKDQVNQGRSMLEIEQLFPYLVARMRELQGQSNQELENDDAAQLAAIPQPAKDYSELYRNADVDQLSSIWRLGKNSFDPQYAWQAFDYLVTSIAKNQRLDYPRSETLVRTQFKALSALSDSQKAAAKLGAELPTTSTPGDPKWSDKSGLKGAPWGPETAKPFNPPLKNPFVVKR